MPDRLLIRGGRVLDPAAGLDLARGDVLVEDGRVAAVGENLDGGDAQVFDASGYVVTPGFVDLHTHLREPGLEYKETIESGTRAAARGGFTTVCCMPNTEPALDSKASIDFVLERARTNGAVRVLPIGCVTVGRAGKTLSEMGELSEAGCIGFSDDGSPVGDAAIMRRALEYASGLRLPVIDHCENPALSGGVMHEGWVSTRLGLKGIPSASEESMIARDIALARQTGAHVHIAHISTAGGVDLVRQAKAEGLRVTSEVTPHHLSLSHELVMGRHGSDTLAYDSNAKMYPPLRSDDDIAACIRGLADGSIDAVATDHAPHAVQEKLCEFDEAAFGVTMLETALSLCLQAVDSGALSFERVIEALTIGPARALNLDRVVPGIGTLAPGAPADIAILDPRTEWTVEPQSFASKGKNTPLGGRTLRGQVVATLYGGVIAHQREGGRELTMTLSLDVQTEVESIREALEAHVDPVYAEGMRRIVPTGQPRHAVRVPQVRRIAADWSRAHKALPVDELEAMAEALWATESREERLVAIVLLARSKQAQRELPWELIERWSAGIDNWEQVDQLADAVAAPMLIGRPELIDGIENLARSEHSWQRRLAIVTLLIAARREPDWLPRLKEMTERLTGDKGPTMRKAVVWARKTIMETEAKIAG